MIDILCSSCSGPIEPDFACCPWCGQRLHACCDRCYAPLHRDWLWCPRCGRKVTPPRAAPMPERDSGAEAHNQAGIAHYDAERLEEAIAEFEQAIALEPDNPIYHANLAEVLQESGDLKQALEHYQRALQIEPEDTGALLNLGHVYAGLDRPQDAARCWRQVLQLDPDGADGEEARAALGKRGRQG